MLNLTDLKNGVIFTMDGDPFVVMSSQHTKLGRGGAILRAKIKNLLNGTIVERTFKGAESFGEANVSKKKAQYLYHESGDYFFMNNDDYEQFSFSEEQVGDNKEFLKEGTEVDVMFFDGKAISITLPIKMNFKVTYTEPGFKGNTQSTTTKPATIETGAQVYVPLFINNNDIIIVDTRTGEYVERA